MTALLVAVGAAVGAPLRFWLSTHLDGRFHTGTLVANVAGSFLLGMFSALALTSSWAALLGVGFCGGFTTYSSFSVQTHDLGPRRGATYAAGTIVLALAACGAGYLLGQA